VLEADDLLAELFEIFKDKLDEIPRRRRPKVGPRMGEYRIGERHRRWPAWVWDGAAFIRA